MWQHDTAMVTIPKHVARQWTRATVRYVEISVDGDAVTIRPLRGGEFLEPHTPEGSGSSQHDVS